MKEPKVKEKTPDEIVTDRIMNALLEKGLLSKDRIVQLKKHFLAGTLDAEEAERLFEFDAKDGRTT